MGLLGPMGPGGFRRRGRRRGLVVGAAVGAVAANRNNAAQQPEEPAVAPVAQDDMSAQLEQLAKLKEEGILTQEEFDAKKKQILGL
jgi:predicted Zn-dependent peptidase